MSGKRNWRKAQLQGKRSMSCLDEQEYRGKDAAARWLERNEKVKDKPRERRARSGEATA